MEVWSRRIVRRLASVLRTHKRLDRRRVLSEQQIGGGSPDGLAEERSGLDLSGTGVAMCSYFAGDSDGEKSESTSTGRQRRCNKGCMHFKMLDSD